MELFDYAPAIQRKKNKQSTKNQPRYYRVGDARFRDGSKITMQIQSRIVGALQGKKKGAGILDADSINRRQAGWKDWGEGRATLEALAFATKELPLIQAQFQQYFAKPKSTTSVTNELRVILFQCNLIRTYNPTTEPPAVTPVATRTATRSVSQADCSVDDEAPPPLTKRPRGFVLEFYMDEKFFTSN